PLPPDLARLGLDLRQRRQRHLQLRRLDGFEEQPGDRRIDAIAAEELARAAALLLVDLVALVRRRGAVARVAYAHPPAAPAAQHQALQQRAALAHAPAALLRAPGAVVLEPPPVRGG